MYMILLSVFFFFFQAEDGIRDIGVTGVQTCALPIFPRGVETHEVVGIVLLLRDVLARSLFEKYQRDFGLLNRVLDAYEPAANRIANTVAVSFVEERERVIRQQQDALRELSTPVLPRSEERRVGKECRSR